MPFKRIQIQNLTNPPSSDEPEAAEKARDGEELAALALASRATRLADAGSKPSHLSLSSSGDTHDHSGPLGDRHTFAADSGEEDMEGTRAGASLQTRARRGRRPRSPLPDGHLPAIASSIPTHCPLHVSRRYRCAFCARLRRSRQTRMYCPDCNVGLCIGEARGESCFGLWHGLLTLQGHR